MPLIGTSNLPIAPLGTPWHPKAAKERIFEQCGDNVACAGRGFLWRAPGFDGRDPTAYSLGICDVIDGRLHIVPKAVAHAAGIRGLGTFALDDETKDAVRRRITALYDRIRSAHADWPVSPFQPLVADASGTPFEGTIALEGEETGDGRFIELEALVWELPIPLVFDKAEMDHSGATIGTINAIERRDGGVIHATGALSDSEDPETQALVLRASELFAEGAIGVSVDLDSVDSDLLDENGNVIPPNAGSDELPDDLDWEKVVTRVLSARIRSVAVVDTAAFIDARVSLAASTLVAGIKAKPEWFASPGFGNGSTDPADDGGDKRLVWQEPEHPEEIGQFGCPLEITEDGYVYGHLGLWHRCHVGYAGTCVRPPKEPAAYRGFLTGERIPGIPTGPLVMKTTHADNHLSAQAAAVHYDHTGYSPADLTVGPDAYGIWVSGALRSDVTEGEIEMLRGSALSGDWRVVGGRHRLIGVLAVSAPGFRVARALAASGTLITIGPGCQACAEVRSYEDRLSAVERALAEGIVAGL